MSNISPWMLLNFYLQSFDLNLFSKLKVTISNKRNEYKQEIRLDEQRITPTNGVYSSYRDWLDEDYGCVSEREFWETFRTRF
jgi:hypothetical protein